MQPVKRSKLRLYFGKKYYQYKRYLEWYFGGVNFARSKLEHPLAFPVFEHRTPLLRKLKNVDMWFQYNKIINLKIAAARLDGIVIQPGETFSYWKLLGNPTKRKGYVDGMVLFYGTYKAGIGGGLCQLSNLIYWMTLHTPLEVTERHRHSYDVFPDSNRTQPFGSGATCSYNYFDLRIHNPTEQPYQLKVYLTEDDLVGQWRTTTHLPYQYEIYEKDHRIKLEYWGGYSRHNSIYRKVYNSKLELITDEFITENHALMMYEPLLQAKDGRSQTQEGI